jgi:hypothetical protein
VHKRLPVMGLAETSGPSGKGNDAPQLRSKPALLSDVQPAHQITLVAKDVCAYVPLLPGLGEGKEKQVSN